jgi:hypothetical protein
MTIGEAQSTAAQKIYQRAYEMHYTEKDYEGAVSLYREVIERFPMAKEAGYAATQIENIDGMSPEDMAAEREREDQKARDERAAPTPKRNVRKIESRFGALRTVSGALKVLAFINAIGGGIAALIAFSSRGGAMIGLPMLLAAAFSVVLCWALAEVVLVVLAIEENTRRAALAAEGAED